MLVIGQAMLEKLEGNMEVVSFDSLAVAWRCMHTRTKAEASRRNKPCLPNARRHQNKRVGERLFLLSRLDIDYFHYIIVQTYIWDCVLGQHVRAWELRVKVCCSVLQCVSVLCSVVQHGAA